MTETEEQKGSSVDTYTAPQSDSLIHYKYDTQSYIQHFKITLQGKIIEYYEDEYKNIVSKEIKIGEPLVNDCGFQAIVNRIQSICNSQNVHGNLSDQSLYQNYISKLRFNINDEIFVNRKEWGILVRNYEYIIDSIMDSLSLFLTRTINNEERKSQMQSRYVETNTVQNNRGSFLGIGKR